MQPILVIGYCALFVLLIRRLQFFRIEGLPAYFSGVLFLIKVIAGCILGWIYTYYYTDKGTSDSLKFFNDSGLLFDTLHTNFKDFISMLTGIDGNAPELRHYYENMATWLNRDVLFNDNKTIIRVNTLFRFFSLGHYYVHVVFINFLSLTGMIALLKIFTDYCSEKKLLVGLLTMCLPSVLFWGSGLLKDPLLIFVFGLLCYTIYKIQMAGFSRKRMALFLLLLVGLMFIKLYVLLIIFPGILVWMFSRNWSTRRTAVIMLTAYVIYFAAAFNVHHVNKTYNVSEIIYYKQVNFYRQAEYYGARSLIEIPRIEPTVSSLIKNAPPAFATTLFRPTPIDAKANPLILLSAIENVFLVLILLLGIYYFRKKPGDGFLLFCAIFLFLLFALIGLITPVLGALVRYRMPGLPFLMFLTLYYSDLPPLFTSGRNKSPN